MDGLLLVPEALNNVLTQPLRIILFAAASFAALRIQHLTGPDPRSMGIERP